MSDQTITMTVPAALATAFAELFAKKIKNGELDFYAVPEPLRAEVAQILISWGLIDLVPEEYRP